MKDRISLDKGDITEMAVDAIVNAANDDLILGGGVAGAIRRKGGPKIQEECNAIKSVPLGEAAVTTGGNLKAKYVIHAASMSLGSWTTKDSLRKSTINSLLRAKEKEAKTIAFPAIGTGVAGFPIDYCAQIMIDTVSAFLANNPIPEKVYFVLYDAKTYDAFKEYYDTKFGANGTIPTGEINKK